MPHTRSGRTSRSQRRKSHRITRQAVTKRRPGAVPPKGAAPIDVETAGGTGRIVYDQQSGTWAWADHAANGTSAESEDDAGHGTSEAAAAAVGAFLAANTMKETD